MGLGFPSEKILNYDDIYCNSWRGLISCQLTDSTPPTARNGNAFVQGNQENLLNLQELNRQSLIKYVTNLLRGSYGWKITFTKRKSDILEPAYFSKFYLYYIVIYMNDKPGITENTDNSNYMKNQILEIY